MTISQAYDLAVQHHHAGRRAEAEALYRRILEVQPNHAGALHLLGLIAHQAGRHDLAVDMISQSIVFDPSNPIAHSNLGEAFRAIGRLDDALAACRRAIELKPDFPNAHLNLGNALREKGQLEVAASAYRRALQFKPDYPEAHNNLGNALRDQGQVEQAASAYQRALHFKPGFPEAHYNMGILLRDRGRLDEAIAAYRRAVELRPNYPDAYNNMGVALRERGRVEDAIGAYRRALELKPGYPEALNNLGAALTDRRQFDEAIAAYRRALELKPGYPEAYNNLGSALKDRGELDEAIAAFRSALHFRPEFAEAHSNLVFILHFHPGYDAQAIAGECARWERQHAAPLHARVNPHGNDRNPDRRLKIGYVSSNFYAQSECYFVIPLFEAHDHHLHEIHAYSDVGQSDPITERLKKSVDVWRDVRVSYSDEQLAEQIRKDNIDVLIDLDMHMGRNRLPTFARQPAPVQVAWLAYPGSTGLRSIGYRLTDSHMEPPGEKPAWSAEESVRLPDCWCCYHPVGQSPEINALPALSANGVTFGSLNNFAKIREGALARWARVLEAVKGSRLVMLCPEGRAREQVRAFFGAQGIVSERVELIGFIPRWEYLMLYQRIDVGLDPFPYNGITTTCDALWMGVPILTLPGETPASRAGLSLLSTVGLTEFAAYSEEDYVQLAAGLASDLPRLANLRATLRPRMQASPLMDAPRFARNVEAAYRSMWQEWCKYGQ